MKIKHLLSVLVLFALAVLGELMYAQTKMRLLPWTRAENLGGNLFLQHNTKKG